MMFMFHNRHWEKKTSSEWIRGDLIFATEILLFPWANEGNFQEGEGIGSVGLDNLNSRFAHDVDPSQLSIKANYFFSFELC